VYIDTPPLLPVIDTTLLLPMVDRILFVVCWRKTPQKVVLGAAQLLGNFPQRVSGVVVNNVVLDKLVSYDPYSTYHHKSYQEYYVG
jgi:Mrp family chromosome partitioning ATPase